MTGRTRKKGAKNRTNRGETDNNDVAKKKSVSVKVKVTKQDKKEKQPAVEMASMLEADDDDMNSVASSQPDELIYPKVANGIGGVETSDVAQMKNDVQTGFGNKLTMAPVCAAFPDDAVIGDERQMEKKASATQGYYDWKGKKGKTVTFTNQCLVVTKFVRDTLFPKVKFISRESQLEYSGTQWMQ
jgi:hypothetical protein